MYGIAFKVKFLFCILCLASLSNVQAAPSQPEIDNATTVMDKFKELFLPFPSNSEAFDESCGGNCFLKSGVLGPVMDSVENWELVGHVAVDLRGQNDGWIYHIAPLIRHVNSGVSDSYYVADASKDEILPLESWADGYELEGKNSLALFEISDIANSKISSSVSPEQYNKTLDELRSAAENINPTEISIAVAYRDYNLRGAMALIAIKTYLERTLDTSPAVRAQNVKKLSDNVFRTSTAQIKAIFEADLPSRVEFLKARSTGWGCFD